MLFIETERLILRDFEVSDFDDVHEYSSDYENVKHMMFGPNTPEQTREYLEKQCIKEKNADPRMHYNIALQRKEDGKVLGGISLHASTTLLWISSLMRFTTTSVDPLKLPSSATPSPVVSPFSVVS